MEKQLRSILVEQASKHRDKKVGVFLSAGVDSQAVLFACLEAGIKPVCISFTRDDHDSRDYKYAKEIAKYFDLEFIRVAVPSDIDTLKKHLFHNIRFYKLKNPAEIECVYIIKFAFIAAAVNGVEVVFTGHGADTQYGSSKNASLRECEGKNTDEIRKKEMSKPNWNQRITLKQICYNYEISYVPFYQSKKVVELFKNTTFAELKEKEAKFVTKEAFREYFNQIKKFSRGHQNYQKGDTKFQDMFDSLLKSDWMIRDKKFKKPVVVYNDIKNGKIKYKMTTNRLFSK